MEKITEVKEKLRQKFKEKGLNEDQIQMELNRLDCEFSIHLFVNGKYLKESTMEERLDFYHNFLEMQLKE